MSDGQVKTIQCKVIFILKPSARLFGNGTSKIWVNILRFFTPDITPLRITLTMKTEGLEYSQISARDYKQRHAWRPGDTT